MPKINKQNRNNMWNSILSGLRIIFTPIVLIMAIIGILVCILEDLISYIFKLIWNKKKQKSYKTSIVNKIKLPTLQADRGLIATIRNVREIFTTSSGEFTKKRLTLMKSDVENTEYYNDPY